MHLKKHHQMLWHRFLSNQHHLYPHMSQLIKIMLLMMLTQFVGGRKRIFSCKTHVEGKQTVYAEHHTQPGFDCQMQSSNVTKIHTWCCGHHTSWSCWTLQNKKRRWKLHKSERNNKEKVNSSLGKTHNFYDGLILF